MFSQSAVSLCDPMECSVAGFPVLHYPPDLLKLMPIESKMPCYYLILCRPLLLLPSIFPSIRVFSSKSALRIRWPNYWSFTFSISPSNEYSGLISFRIDWFDHLAVQATLKSSPPQFKSISNLSSVQFSSVAQPCPTLRHHELQQARPSCPSPTPGVHPN